MQRSSFFILGALLATFLIFIPDTGNCQTPGSEQKPVWFEAGIGDFASENFGTGITLILGLTRAEGQKAEKIRFQHSKEINIFGPFPEAKLYSLGVLTGRRFADRYFDLSLYAGLGLSGGLTRGKYSHRDGGWIGVDYYEDDYFVSPAIPLEITLLYKPHSLVALGFGLNADLNMKNSTFNYALKLCLGRIK
jgi:hypothetical protein